VIQKGENDKFINIDMNEFFITLYGDISFDFGMQYGILKKFFFRFAK